MKPLNCWNRVFESRRSSFVFVLCRVGSGLWNGLISRSEQSCRVCDSECHLQSFKRRWPRSDLGWCAITRNQIISVNCEAPCYIQET
jgi:hypothetical protein